MPASQLGQCSVEDGFGEVIVRNTEDDVPVEVVVAADAPPLRDSFHVSTMAKCLADGNEHQGQEAEHAFDVFLGYAGIA
ncbi:hypothetical protein [Streptomyces ochraceiscleroticus]|uniref:Uncharacterized protein n=1 Tax=Streptomyces ochraceiscleroticus TaxID=47761 RepID=A0ABW1MJP0_9ACTN|nr:hypothetical protein [Streptomyces ochraceiscleroticus]